MKKTESNEGDFFFNEGNTLKEEEPNCFTILVLNYFLQSTFKTSAEANVRVAMIC